VNTAISHGTPSDKAILGSLTPIHPDKLEVSMIPSTWQTLTKIDANIEIRPADARILTALSLGSHSDMWTWFNNQVTNPTRYLAAIPISSFVGRQLPEMPNEWIFPLFRSIQTLLLVGSSIVLKAKTFFPELDAQDYASTPGGSLTASRILHHVEAAVALWLQFCPRPGMSLSTSRAVATFTSIAREAFSSSSFLYLNHIQNSIKKLRSFLTEEKTPLTKVPWERLAEELKNHPLAHPNSNEALAVEGLKELLWAISSLPHPHSTNTSVYYKKAIEIGGDAGIEASAQVMTQQPHLP
jgi:hypothetical protein